MINQKLSKSAGKDGLDSGKLVPILDRSFPLEQIADAHRYMESNQQQGKIVVTLP